jgi:phenylalanyl-tRNA synthetase beta chain
MKVPVRSLREMVPVNLSMAEIAHRLTMAGLAVESIEQIGARWDDIYVGVVERVEQHPNADRLVLATVTAGEHHLTVVTGAPNIASGQKVALAIAGARLVDGYSDEPRTVTLKPSTIRGVRSEGMVCSEKELGLSDEHAGILVLEPDAPIGVPLKEYLGDEVMEFEITPNMVHAYSIVGIARELAALTATPALLPTLADLSGSERADGLVRIDAPDLCSRYIGVVIEGIRVEPSPDWMQRRLTAVGVRPINNIVDVTNYVMLEWGQPLHAFDREHLAEGRIIVRRAEPGERMESLDHIERQLSDDTLVIADAERAVAIAGVMGGVDSEIADDTTTILLESASFNMLNVRRTARAQRLRTEASSRFERGIDPNLAWTATCRAVELITELNPNAHVTLVADEYPVRREPRTVIMPRGEIKRLLGVDYPDETVIGVLERLDFQPELIEVDGEPAVRATVPTYRSDISLKADLVEEVARIVGYELLPETLPVGQTAPVFIDPTLEMIRAVQDRLVAAGLTEIITYPMISEEDLVALDPDRDTAPDRLGAFARPDQELVTALNPLRSEWQHMRPTMFPALLRNVAENVKFSPYVAVFETGRVYVPAGIDQLPDERRTLAVAITGVVERADLYGAEREVDYFDIKGVLDATLPGIGAEYVRFRSTRHPSLHPGRAAEIVAGGVVIGVAGEIHPRVAEHFGINREQRVAVAEIDLVLLSEHALRPFRYRPISRHQPVEQDFAIVVDEGTPAGDVDASLREAAGPLATSISLFDVYRGESVGTGKKSLAFRIAFAAPDRTLSDSDLEKIRRRIERQIQKQVGGQLRG